MALAQQLERSKTLLQMKQVLFLFAALFSSSLYGQSICRNSTLKENQPKDSLALIVSQYVRYTENKNTIDSLSNFIAKLQKTYDSTTHAIINLYNELQLQENEAIFWSTERIDWRLNYYISLRNLEKTHDTSNPKYWLHN